MNIALYARVSTEGMKHNDGSRLRGQSVDPQIFELREYASRNNFTITREYSDIMSGTKAARPGLDQLVQDAKKQLFSLVLVVKLDRLGRSVINVIKLVDELDKAGVSILCTTQGIDTRKDSPCGRMILQVMAAFAEFERAIISERTIAGLAVVKSRGVQLGKPSPKLVAEHLRAPIIAEWRKTGQGYRVLAKNLGGVSPMTARKLAAVD